MPKSMHPTKPIFHSNSITLNFEKKRYMDKRSTMYKMVQDWKSSGLSRELFAKQHGITFHSLEYWCRKLKRESTEPADSQQAASITSRVPSFIELAHDPVSNSPRRLSRVELELPGGLCIRIY